MKDKLFFVIKVLVYLIQIVCSGALIYSCHQSELIPMDYLIGFGVLFGLMLIGEYFLIFYKKKKYSKRSIFTQLLSIMLSGAMVVGSFYAYKAGRIVDLLTEQSFQERAFSLIVLQDSEIRNEAGLTDQKFGCVSAIDEETINYAKTEFSKKYPKIQYQDYEDFSKLVEGFYKKEVDGLLLDEAFRPLIEQEKTSFEKDTRVIAQVTKNEEMIQSKSVDVLTKPFLVYVSGSDQYGKVAAVSRSDVNVLAAINPVTHQILLVSIPRDMYYPLHKNGQYDKFTHAGIYGIQESIATLEDCFKQDVNYYGKMNFTSFLKIVDAMGGVDITIPKLKVVGNKNGVFTTRIYKYTMKPGKTHMDAKHALAFVRERKSFLAGDFERGKNQQRMISAIIKQLCSPAILTSFSKVLDTISGCVKMNFSSEEINALVKMQLSQMPEWKIQAVQIEGSTARKECYSSGSFQASVVIPYESSLNEIRGYIDDMMNNKEVKVRNDILKETKDKKNK